MTKACDRIMNQWPRYALVVIILICAFIFGKDLATDERDIESEALTANGGDYKITALEMTPERDQARVENIFKVKKGDTARLLLKLETWINVDDAEEEESAKDVQLYVYALSDLNDKQELGVIKLIPQKEYPRQEMVFRAGSDLSGLLFKRVGKGYRDTVKLSDFMIENITDEGNLPKFEPTIIGRAGTSGLVLKSKARQGHYFSFSHHGQYIGETFVAHEPSISKVTFKLRFRGSGGLGHYFLELKEAKKDKTTGKISLSKERIAYYRFDKRELEKAHLRQGKDEYILPLAANLEVGKQYFIGIGNHGVNFNILNTLEIYGSSDTQLFKEGDGYSIIRGKSSEVIGDIDLSVYGVDYMQVQGERILSNAVIQDLGDGRGLYSYHSQGNGFDFLDINAVSAVKDQQSNVFYDNVQRGISAFARYETDLTYKFHAIYPVERMRVAIEQVGGECADLAVYYSYDGNTWEELPKVMNYFQFTGKFDGTLDVNKKSNNVYVKITYDREDAKLKTLGLFAIKYIRVEAELAMQGKR